MKRIIKSDQKTTPVIPKGEGQFGKGTVSKESAKERRTDIADSLDVLKEKRSFFGKLFGFYNIDIVKEEAELRHNYEKLKENFETYKEVGIEIPENIAENFENLDDTPRRLSAEQAQILEDLAKEGEARLEAKKPIKDMLGTKDLVRKVGSELTYKDSQSLSSVNKTLYKTRESEKESRIILTPAEFMNLSNEKIDSEKLKFARDNKLKIKLDFSSASDEDRVRFSFVMGKVPKELLKRIEFIETGDIKDASLASFLKIAEELFKVNPEFTFSCGMIQQNIHFDDQDKMPTFVCKDLDSNLIFSKNSSLVSFSCQNIKFHLLLQLCPNLISFSCEGIQKNGHCYLSELPKLEYLRIGNVEAGGKLGVKKCPNLKEFSFDREKIKDPGILQGLEELKKELEQKGAKGEESLSPEKL